MTVSLSGQIHLDIDISVYLAKHEGLHPEAVIDRRLVDLLLAIESTKSVQEACDQLNCSTRYAQRKLKRFTDSSGLSLLQHHGWRGTSLSAEGRQCIALYVATRDCVEQIVRAHKFPRALPPLSNFPSSRDWNHRSL